MIYKSIAVLILLAFYGIYLGKMFTQKKKGIITDQIAKGKGRGKRFFVELIMKIATYCIIIAEVVSIFVGYSMIGDYGKYIGIALGVLGVAIFGSAVWTMRDSWRAGIAEKDKTEMVTHGIYNYSRNPAFVGFDLVYIGILLMYFNLILLFLTVFAIIMLHLQILEEEKYLPTVFGKEYSEYKSHTFRYWGRK